ncbi:MAG: GTPase Era [Elusimicrobia bacterium]|nr:GTPase Era [Elusimicrobiota bacterium]
MGRAIALEPGVSPKPGFKAGYVALVGRPNAGKSTLLNALLKQKLSIVSPLPQTTRHKVLGILSAEDYQACFLDTPGLLDAAKDGLQESLRRAARAASRDDAEVLVLVTEPRVPSAEELAALQGLRRGRAPLLVAVNKTDLVQDPARLEAAARAYAEGLSAAQTHLISALQGQGVERLLAAILALLPESPPYYGSGQVSDRWERFFAAELIREKIFELYRDEVPHACAVAIEDYQEGSKDRLSATVFVEREPQKGILIGSGGSAIRRLTEESRKAIAAFVGRPVAVDLRIKVRRNWRRDPRALREFGY